MRRKKSLRKKISLLVGKITMWRKPYWLVRFMIRIFVRFYHIDMSDYNFTIKRGVSFHDFFTIRLKPGAMHVAGAIVSPVDAKIMSFGMAGKTTTIRAKGLDFVFSELIDCDHHYQDEVSYTVLYLSPADYHRIHAPFDMQIDEVRHIPGNLFSVKPKSVQKREKLYSINERVLLTGTSAYGRFWIVLIGAFLVGSVKLNFSSVTTNQRYRKNKTHTAHVSFNAGDEIGHFRFGSTVVMCIHGDLFSKITYQKGERVLMGEELVKSLV